MYSYHGRATSGGFKRGHGGKNYRRPPERQTKETTPPPIKECTCVIEINLDEYSQPCSSTPQRQRQPQQPQQQPQQPSPRRIHQSFNGRTSMEACKRKCREMRVHLVIPGRNQKGPVSIVARSYQDALPATKWLLEQIVVSNWNINDCGNDHDHGNDNDNDNDHDNEEGSKILKGRIIFNVNVLKNNNNNNNQRTQHDEKVGYFVRHTHTGGNYDSSIQDAEPSNWFFKCLNHNWCIMVCKFEPDLVTLSIDDSRSSSTDNQNNNREADVDVPFEEDDGTSTRHLEGRRLSSYYSLSSLITCLDNVKFRIGNNNTEQIDWLMDKDGKSIFAFGPIEKVTLLYEQIKSNQCMKK